MAKVIVTRGAIKDLKKISSLGQRKITLRLKVLKKNVFAGKKLGGELRGSYSLRIWPYRVIYIVIKGEVWITHISHRQGAYK